MAWAEEAERILEETRTWRANRVHLRFGGRGGFFLTAGALAAAGWVDITTLEHAFHLAITPLAVLWGFQQISNPSDGGLPASEQRTSGSFEKLAQLGGMFAVVAILILIHPFLPRTDQTTPGSSKTAEPPRVFRPARSAQYSPDVDNGPPFLRSQLTWISGATVRLEVVWWAARRTIRCEAVRDGRTCLWQNGPEVGNVSS